MNKLKYIVCSLLLLLASGTLTSQTTIRVLNINTRMSGQMVGYNAAPFADYIEQYNPDFVMLQEIDYKTARNGFRDFTTELAAETGYFSAFGRAIAYSQGEYGVAILSKYPIEKISNTQLTGNASEMKEMRTVLFIDVILPDTGEKIRMAVTHLDHSTDGVRQSMVQQLNGAIGSSFPTLLAGDFNAFPSETAISTGMASWKRVCNNFATFPASNPSRKIDYIFAQPTDKWNVKSYQVLSNSAAITDHCALLAEVELQ
ncbi:endonuclease/exonuclease/phosphatase family protein [Proteiniphilum sp. X52]|uniref:endonuclease/exonuclease/phosphatase family protein n=1 Tax=Proteiniphilum sp. X52 TaxID=2382159 RepID=UPI002100D640|nr:endonuclease/exonuclease/phosphatase family protein [Proteiniphilum sp. X52]